MGIDSRDVARLFEQHGPAVYRRARRILGRHEDAEEATQEIFIRALRAAGEFQGASQATTWLYRITTNHCLNMLRDSRRRTQLVDQHVKPTAGEAAPADPDAIAHVRALLARADERQARAAVLVFMDGMTYDEAAAVMGVSRRTLGNLLERFQAWAREQEGAPQPKPLFWRFLSLMRGKP
jgi:RNA polymerase sigma-70 factor (ECF subfamily)